MAINGFGKRGTEHEKKFPLPEIGEDTLIYKGISIPLEGGHRMIFGLFSSRLRIKEDGWDSEPSPWQNAREMYLTLKYKNEEAARHAITKLNIKFKKFDKEGLVMRIKGDYRLGFHLTLSYKKLKSTGTK